ncbi:MAG: sodium:alanine symporter family protein [Lachnospiraceae bacterium]|jgi:AGCS family alanine or glycine:cation symporter|nr:sodium:alanine symporter family protein [Lachnospiraceae bacterium]
MEALQAIVTKVNGLLWDQLLIVVLVGSGIWFTILLRFIQVRGFTKGFKMTFGGLFAKKGVAGKDGMSSFQSLATAIAAQVGTGNIAGAATAIAVGGPGAIFWMWVAAFFGMATIFAEATMAQKFKIKDSDGAVTGGPVYYIKGAFHNNKFGKFLAGLFAVLIILALGFMGNAVQSNSIGAAWKSAFGINPLIIGVILAVLAFMIFAGGVGRIAKVTETLVPFMAGFYIIGSLIILIMNITHLPGVFEKIVVLAFDPQAISGGVLGATMKVAIKKGVARGLFSNEAGMGSTPHAHAIAKVKHPAEQGFVAMMGVFIDTFVILNLTAFVIIITGVIPRVHTATSLQGADLSQAAFTEGFHKFGAPFIAICLLFFAFSTIVGWYFFGEANVRYLFGKKAVKPYAVLVCICIILGTFAATLDGGVQVIWDMADCFNGLMVIPNILGLLVLSKMIKSVHDDYYKNFSKGLPSQFENKF